MWDCWVTLEREWIRLRGQPGLYCKEEMICLREWVLSQSAGSCLCRRPLDPPGGTNHRMCGGNLNSFITWRNLIHDFWLERTIVSMIHDTVIFFPGLTHSDTWTRTYGKLLRVFKGKGCKGHPNLYEYFKSFPGVQDIRNNTDDISVELREKGKC